MSDTVDLVTRKERLVGVIYQKLAATRNSHGYRDTAVQIADELLDRMPVTAQQISALDYYVERCEELSRELRRLKARPSTPSRTYL